jgi:hypothetical protein
MGPHDENQGHMMKTGSHDLGYMILGLEFATLGLDLIHV